ncbi:MAG: Ig-like domain repeat protein [Methanomassiliicoccaceae archaeon]|nr:Ig-like domain repeat protein [Methanomassiliicoccaceae archaeon]
MPKTKPDRFSLTIIMVIVVAMLFTVTVAANTSLQTTEAAGSTLTVTNENDSGAGSLRAALASAQNGDIIVFDPAVATVTLTGGEILFSQRDLIIDGSVGHVSGVIITRGGTSEFRLLNCTAPAGTLTLKGLTLQNGKTGSTDTSGSGGGMYVNCALAAENCNFTGNSTQSTGGGIYSGQAVSMTDCTFTGNTSRIAGGGLYVNKGDTVLTRCGFANNTSSTSAGGGLYSNSNVTMTGCEFKNNTATGGNGGGVRSFGNVTASNCTFTGNVTSGSGNGSGGGIWANNNVVLDSCVFTNNTARIHGSGVSVASNAALMILTNCTFANNKHYASSPANVGAIDCAIRTYIFQSTIVNNLGGGIYADSGKTVYLHNSIIIGNTNAAGTVPLQTVSGNVNYITSLVEGSTVSGNTVTNRQVFGINTFDAADGTLKVLTNGIAAGAAQALSTSDIVGYAGLSSSDRAAIDASIAALARDQIGSIRSTAGSVTYGAVENGLNSLTGISVGTNPAKTQYIAGETIDLTGTLLDLTYSNGTDSGIPYTEPGMTNTSGTVNMNTVGSKQIDFTFIGVTTSVSLNITVKDDTVTALSSNKSSTVFGEKVTFVALVTPVHAGSGLPTGTVEFFDGVTSIGTATLNVLGIGSITISDRSIGSHSITAIYSGDGNYNDSSFSAISLTVGPADTAIIVTSVALDTTGAPSSWTVTFKAHLSVVLPGSDNSALNGLPIEFVVDGYTLLASCDAFGDITHTETVDDLVLMGMSLPGIHTIMAIFNGDSNFNSCMSSVMNHDVGYVDTSIILAVVPSSTSVYGEAVQLNATLYVDPALLAGLPGGTGLLGAEINLYDNGVQMMGTFTCDYNGVFSIPLFAPSSFGSHLFTAEFTGNSTLGLNASTKTISHVVLQASVTVSVVVPLLSSVYGEDVTISANVVVNSPGVANLIGMDVIFYAGAYIIGTGTLDASGNAYLTTNALTIGSNSILAAFPGNMYIQYGFGSNSYTVNKAQTDVSLSISGPASTYGDVLTLTATVTVEAPGAGTPTGMVEFYAGMNLLGTAALSGNTATFSTTLDVGSYTIHATYLGDSYFDGDSSVGQGHNVDKRGTTTTLSSVPSSSVIGEEVNFIAKVVPDSLVGRPTGTVGFYDENMVLLGTGALDADGRAAFSIDTLPVGIHKVTARYLGDGNFTASDSSVDHKVTEKSSGGYYITATADGGSKITPSGKVMAQSGKNMTFYFSAADGYSISSVSVNGFRLTQEQVDLGYYTFQNVMANNAIDVKSTFGPKTNITLIIDVVDGGGHAEYSVNGSSFIAYTSAVSIPYDADLRVRAVAEDSHSFEKWEIPAKRTSSEISFSNVETSLHLDLYFGDDSSDNNLLWWVLGLILLLILILIIIFILWRRRKDDDEKASS